MKLKKLFFNKVTLLVVVIAVAVGGNAAWKKYNEPPAEKKYKFHTVELGDVTQTVSANGTLNPVVLVQVGTQVSGTVMKWYADFNDHVKKGQVLLEIDPALFKAQLNQSRASVLSAEAALDLAKSNQARTRALFAQEYATQQDLDNAVQAFKAAKAQLELAKAQMEKDATNLDYTVIRSPVSGVVVSRQIDVGQTVAASFQTPTLFTIAQDLAQMQIDSNYAEADIGGIKVGQPTRFTVDAYPNRLFEGKVRQIRINPTTQSNVVTYDVVVDVNNEDLSLFPGMTAYVNIVVAQKKGVLLVPNAALRFKPPAPSRKPGAYVAGKDEKRKQNVGTVHAFENGRFLPISIAVGITDNKVTEVVSGDLKLGDKIVVEELVPTDSGQQSTFKMRMF